MGGDGGDNEGSGGVLSSGIQTNHQDDGETCGVHGVVISPGGGGTRSSGITPHIGVHLDMAGNYSGKGVMIPHL